MPDLIRSSLPWLLCSLLPVLLLLLVPLVGAKARRTIAVLLGLGALAACVVAVIQGGAERSLEVINPFPQPPDGEPQPIVFDQVTAPGWQWGVAYAAFLAVAALAVYATRNRAAKPGLVFHPLLVTAWSLGLRLALEKTAAPSGFVWATGVTMTTILVVLFVGLYAGRRGVTFGRFALGLFALALLQRALVVGASWVLTSEAAGTHLDMNALERMYSPMTGEQIEFVDAQDAWMRATLVPQMTLWVVMTMVAGLVLGGLTWAMTRKRSKSA